jgi:hypothetical protein
LFIPIFGKINPNLKDAIDNAIEVDNGYSTFNLSKNSSEKTTGNALIDGVFYVRHFGIPPLFEWNIFQGTPPVMVLRTIGNKPGPMTSMSRNIIKVFA